MGSGRHTGTHNVIFYWVIASDPRPPASSDGPPFLSAPLPERFRMPATRSLDRTLSISSVVIGVTSLLCGFALFPPLVGVIVGLWARQREPEGAVIATWGIGLNIVVLLGWVIVLAVLVMTGTLAQLLRP